MSIPTDLKYTKSHEWVKTEADGNVSVGITDHAQELLGDMVFVELPQVGDTFTQKQECAVAESVKAAADVYSPVSGEVVEVNSALVDNPENINQDAFGSWLFKLKPSNPAEVEGLLDATGYQALLDSEEH
ncbi:glycine cleavage system protein GcvH [Nitrosomonas sp.]|uniref:glycine cleavage system protein GcvH n=1 Tax=Nitrosomonas sp. TaxID=42353 RepID=UPI00284F90AC|nr:glycine cleavage system protein GcvH [Nitrosomonas sp.]MCP5242376.1 glycine cleavage system protein GcvH [Burkholderiales bacterium]MDR4514626.1 glycine cleavage system protein GcvH [Nitrosomonas sp.]